MGTSVAENITLISFHFDIEHNLWTRKDFMNKEIHSPYKKSFVLNIFGQVYFLRPGSEHYVYDIKNDEWQISSPIIDDKILEESSKLSIIRLS